MATTYLNISVFNGDIYRSTAKNQPLDSTEAKKGPDQLPTVISLKNFTAQTAAVSISIKKYERLIFLVTSAIFSNSQR
jgi:hypothetical protein